MKPWRSSCTSGVLHWLRLGARAWAWGMLGACLVLPATAETRLRLVPGPFVDTQPAVLAARIEAMGGEHALAFSLAFDPARLAFEGATAAGAATNLIVNAAAAGAGRVGVVVSAAPGEELAAGDQDGVDLHFTVHGGAGEVSVRFTGDPVALATVDAAGNGMRTTYGDATIAVLALQAPVVVAGPRDQRVRAGFEARFTVEVASAVAPSFQWQKDGQDLPGRTAAALVVPSVSAADAGQYQVVVRNPAGAVVSAAARLELDPRASPVFRFEPASQEVRPGESVVLDGDAGGHPPAEYAWFRAGSSAAVASGPVLALDPVRDADVGEYRLVAWNELGAVTSRVARVRLTTDPRVLGVGRVSAGAGISVAVPVTLEALGGEAGVSFTIEFDPAWLGFERVESRQAGALAVANASAAGDGRVGVAFALPPGEGFGPGLHAVCTLVFRTLDLPGDVPLVMSGSVLPLGMVDARGAARGFTPVSGSVAVLGVPRILAQPQPVRGVLGSRVELEVEAIGPAPMTYQWFRDGREVTGAVGPVLALEDLGPGNSGRYAVRITGPAGSTHSDEADVGIGRLLRARHSRGRVGEPVGVPVQLMALGDEQGVGFSLRFDPSVLEWVEARPGRNLGPGATLLANVEGAASGRVGIVVSRGVDAGAAGPFAEGLQEIAVAIFRCRVEFPGTPVEWADSPVPIEVVDAAGRPLPGMLTAAGRVLVQGGADTGGDPARVLVSPDSRTVVAGDRVRFEAVVSGDPVLAYRWFRDGREIAGIGGPVLELAAATPGDAGEYWLRVTNRFGAGQSLPARLTVREPPRVVLEPGSVRVVAGAEARFVVGVEGTAPLAYQWRRQGLAIGAAGDGPTLVLSSVRTADAGDYHVVVTNRAGRVESRVARLTVLEPPRLDRAPAAASAPPGGRVEFLVEVSGTGPFQYQWRLNGQDIPVSANPTATGARLVIAPVERADGGMYSVVVTGDGGSILSEPVFLSLTGIRLVAPGDAFANAAGLAGEGDVVRSSNRNATREEPREPRHAGKPGGASVWFRWTAPRSGSVRVNTLGSGFDTLLGVYTGDALGALSEVASDDDHGGFFTSDLRFNAVAGTTYAIAVDGLGGVTGEVVLEWRLTPSSLPVPRILRPPPPLTALPDARVRLDVVAEDATAFQWRRNGVPVPGATSAELVLPRLTEALVGSYDVVVTGPGGIVTSAPAQVERGTDPGVRSTDKLRELLGRLRAGGGVPMGLSLHSAVAGIGAGGVPIWNVSAGAPLRHTADNTTATTEAGEPAPCGPGGHSIWFLLELDRPGTLVLAGTSAAGFPVALALYTEANVFSGVPLGCATNGLLRLEGVKAGLYVLAADGVGVADRGSINLEVALGEPPPPAPPETEASPWRDSVPGRVERFTAPQVPDGPVPVYQWFRNGIPIPGATSPNLDVTVGGAEGEGEYSVRVDNRLGSATYRVGRLALDLEPAFAEPATGLRMEPGRFRVGLGGTPGQRMALLHGTDLGAWETQAEFWMGPEGRAEHGDQTVGDAAFRFYRLEEIPLRVVADTGLVVEAEDARAWRVEGGRLGREYVVETLEAGSSTWRDFGKDVVRERSHHFVLPPGAIARVRPQ